MKPVLVTVSLIGLGAVVGAVVVGSLVFEGTVVRQPYERGIAWDEERRLRTASGLRAEVLSRSLRRGKAPLVVGVYEAAGGPVDDPSVEVRLLRPSTAEHDRTYRLGRREDGLFEGVVDLPFRGRWLADVVLLRDGRPIELRLEIWVAP